MANRRQSSLVLTVSFAVLSAVWPAAGCTSSAPVVGQESGAARGGVLFQKRCAECHALPPADGRTLPEWRRVMVDMAPAARLAESDFAAIMEFLAQAQPGSESPHLDAR